MTSKLVQPLKPCNITNLKNCCYVLSQAWSPSLKYHIWSENRKLLPKCYWTLHGLWLRDKKDLGLKFLADDWRDESYSYPTDPRLREHLKQIAPTLYPDTGEYRIHELMYQKHGAVIVQCNSELGPTLSTSKITTSEEYFEKAVKLASHYNICKYITDSPGTLLDLKEVSQRFVNELGVTPYINTFINENTLYINEVYLCFDKDFNLTNCNWVNYAAENKKAKLQDCDDCADKHYCKSQA
ncbi:hypothetical protein HA402_005165 [Bradysia odoriphaga]|nr:hypothetical protein HA402_005165 [Bradysia odoriphaga]